MSVMGAKSVGADLSTESEDDRRRRIAWETKYIAEAYESIAAGLLIDSADVDAWINSIETDHELPMPYAER